MKKNDKIIILRQCIPFHRQALQEWTWPLHQPWQQNILAWANLGSLPHSDKIWCRERHSLLLMAEIRHRWKLTLEPLWYSLIISKYDLSLCNFSSLICKGVHHKNVSKQTYKCTQFWLNDNTDHGTATPTNSQGSSFVRNV